MSGANGREFREKMPRFHPLTVAEVRRETPDCVSLSFSVPAELRERFRFTQGQHVILRAEIDGEELRRTYSICSAVDEGELRIAVKRQPHGRFSGWIHDHLRAGDRIDVMPPRGRFFVPLDPEAARTYVAFVAGSGITPVISILKTTLARESRSRFVLFYGNRDVGSIIFREELEDLKNRYMTRFALHHVLSAEVSDVMELFSGRITPDKLRAWSGRLFHPAEVDAWFLCGPAPMIQDLADTLVELGARNRGCTTSTSPPPATGRARPAMPRRPSRPSARRRRSRSVSTASATASPSPSTARRSWMRPSPGGSIRPIPARPGSVPPAGPGSSRARWTWR